MRFPLATILLSLAPLACIAHAADPAPDILPVFTLTTPEPTHLQATSILYETIHAAPASAPSK